MSHQEKNLERPEEELETASQAFHVPCFLKWSISAGATGIILLCAVFFKRYIDAPDAFASPSDLGLNSIFFFSVSALFVVWTPWHTLGLRITKIGGIEFTEIVAGQASEHAEEISYLQDRIETLEANVRSLNGITELVESFEEPNLRKLLTDFLTKYKEWAFSPSRIRAWGSRQQGFAELAKYEHPFVRSTLQKMVADGLLETRISKKGNTLYRVPLA
jgi:hypothetical protein